MPGLNSMNIEWNKSQVQLVTETMLEMYQGIHAKTVRGKDASPFYTPYQCMLKVLQALYFQFESRTPEKISEEEEQREREAAEKEIRKGLLRPLNPDSRTSALKTSLRAIAYFSWEPESRMFLVRRVFPTYFDFLSVSHIPEGWGVSSRMLEQLQAAFDHKESIRNGSFLKVVDVENAENLPYTLPYLAEQKRLRYKHVLILPVFCPNPPKSDRDMLGTFLFFISDTKGVPKSEAKNQFIVFANHLCKATADLVDAHNKALVRDDLLSKEWRVVRRNRNARARIAEVTLRCVDHGHKKRMCGGLERAAREFLKELTIPNYYAIRDSAAERREKHKGAVFLVTARPDVDLDAFKRRLLRIVTGRLSEKKVVCEVSIKSEDLASAGAFHLKTNHKWR